MPGMTARIGACLGIGDASCQLATSDALWIAFAALGLAFAARRAVRTLYSLRATAWTSVLARPLSRIVRSLDYDEEAFFRADGAGEPIVARRKRGFEALADRLAKRSERSIAFGESLRASFSDLRFADANRVPPPFARIVRERFNLAGVAVASHGPRIEDLDGNLNLDVSGSYGVNVAGYDRYKEWIANATRKVEALGPVLGPVHPLVASNIETLKEISGCEEVSFHTSGTEAVMAAVRLARFNTKREKIVSFGGAYHGWWDGVQPGVGNERQLGDCLALQDMSEASLDVLRRRRDEIAGVLVNPIQCFHPNAPPPNDAVLLTNEVRSAEDNGARYREWLHTLRTVCSECDIPADLRRGLQRLPARARRCPGILRRARRHGALRQDRRRRPADRRRLRQCCTDAALRPRTPDAPRLCDRHVLRASARDGRHGRVPALGAQPRRRGRLQGRERTLPAVGDLEQRALRTGRAAAADHTPGHRMDGALRRARSLPLALPVLPPRRGPRALVGGHGPLPREFRLHGGRLRRPAAEDAHRCPRDAPRWLVGERGRRPRTREAHAHALRQGDDRHRDPDAARRAHARLGLRLLHGHHATQARRPRRLRTTTRRTRRSTC